MLHILGRLQKYRLPKKKVPTEPKEEPSPFEELQRNYVSFCKNKIGTEYRTRIILQEFEELIRIPGLTHISFRVAGSDLELMLGTACVILTNPYTHKRHKIGEFIITINRAMKSIKFENVTNPLRIQHENTDSISIYHHPHINGAGDICMYVGRQEMMYDLVEGSIHKVAEIAVRSLWTLDEHPFKELENWPVVKETSDGTT